MNQNDLFASKEWYTANSKTFEQALEERKAEIFEWPLEEFFEWLTDDEKEVVERMVRAVAESHFDGGSH